MLIRFKDIEKRYMTDEMGLVGIEMYIIDFLINYKYSLLFAICSKIILINNKTERILKKVLRLKYRLSRLVYH